MWFQKNHKERTKNHLKTLGFVFTKKKNALKPLILKPVFYIFTKNDHKEHTETDFTIPFNRNPFLENLSISSILQNYTIINWKCTFQNHKTTCVAFKSPKWIYFMVKLNGWVKLHACLVMRGGGKVRSVAKKVVNLNDHIATNFSFSLNFNVLSLFRGPMLTH